MAKIALSDDAPKGIKRVSLANDEIKKFPHETGDTVLIANAESHPWLKVERDVVEELADQADPFPQVKPEDDSLGRLNDVSNDPEAVRAELARRKGEVDQAAVDKAAKAALEEAKDEQDDPDKHKEESGAS